MTRNQLLKAIKLAQGEVSVAYPFGTSARKLRFRVPKAELHRVIINNFAPDQETGLKLISFGRFVGTIYAPDFHLVPEEQAEVKG